MITFVKERSLIKIHKNDKRVYTIAEKTYRYMNKMGYGSEHVISMIEDVCEMKLPPADIVVIKNYFSTFTKDKKLIKK